MTKQTVGVIGVGMMGHGIARNIQKKGWPLAYLDHPGNQPSDDLDADGATRFDDASALAAACDVLILCVTGSPGRTASPPRCVRAPSSSIARPVFPAPP